MLRRGFWPESYKQVLGPDCASVHFQSQRLKGFKIFVKIYFGKDQNFSFCIYISGYFCYLYLLYILVIHKNTD